MSAKFFAVSPTIWQRSLLRLGHEAVVLYCYVLTSPHRLSEGLFKLPIPYIVGDLDIPAEDVKLHLRALESIGLIFWDEEVDLILDRHALWVNPCRGEKRVPSAIKKLRGLPSSPLLHEFWKLALAHAPDLKDALEGEFPGISDPPDTAWHTPSQSVAHSVSPTDSHTADKAKDSDKERVTAPDDSLSVSEIADRFNGEDVSEGEGDLQAQAAFVSSWNAGKQPA